MSVQSRKIHTMILVKCWLDIAIYGLIASFLKILNDNIFYDLASITMLTSALNLIWASELCPLKGTIRGDIASVLCNIYFHEYLKNMALFFSRSIETALPAAKGQIIPVQIILIPKNGEVYNDLSEADPRIEFLINSASVFVATQGACKRPFHCSLYQILDKKSISICSMEYPYVLNVLKGFDFRYHKTQAEQICEEFYDLLTKTIYASLEAKRQVKVLLFSGQKQDIVDSVKQVLSRLNEV
eukprot:gene4639-20914_t